ncbi:MAG TPA: prepilin-type N-terminal cleavage/methylation domain-containing protein [Terriglobales bacterium]|jgi:prepilin-type N-terminal cleavage/methylation domain-containing protein
MQHRSPISSRGFSLLEMMIALALGLVVTAAAVQLFTKALDATYIVSQRAGMQQDVRAAQNLLIKDISMAGAGLQPGGVAVASGTGTNPRYGCDQSKCYLGGGASPAGIAFPANYIYWIMPGPGMGATLNAVQGPTDVITVVYGDTAFRLNQYQVTFNNAFGTSINFVMPSPAPSPAPQQVSDPALGLKTGDLVILSNNLGGNSQMAVGEVTANVTGTSSPYTAAFANADVLQLNQIAATSGDLRQITGGTNTTALRIWVISYYIDVLPDPSGGGGAGTPRLMRQVNGQPAIPVAENVTDFQITYDTYDTSGNLLVNQPDAGASAGVSPNMIRKVNLTMSARSAIKGTKGFQSLGFQTSVSARNMSFKDRYQ